MVDSSNPRIEDELDCPNDSTAIWLEKLTQGDSEAAERLWNDYYTRLVRLAHKKLAVSKKRVSDEEDLALQVIGDFCEAATRNRFPNLRDRDDLWRLLFTILDRMSKRVIANERRQKRGGGDVRGESAFVGAADSSAFGAMDQQAVAREPTPAEASELAEGVEVLLGTLPAELREVAACKMNGFTNEQIAEQLDCSVRTVKRRLQQIRTCWWANIDKIDPSGASD